MTGAIERTSSGSSFEEIAGYCRATRAGDSITVSGTVASAGEGSSLSDLDTYAQAHRALTSAREAAVELGALTDSVTRTRLYLAPGAVWQEAARAHHDIFASARPANTTLYVSALIPPGALVEVELEAFGPGRNS